MEWKKYRKVGFVEMRPFNVNENIIGVSVSDADKQEVATTGGGMIARNPDNHEDQWYISKQYFENNYEPCGG